MCGIVGCAGAAPVQDLLLDGLARLEYRGYDSAGVCLAEGDGRLTIEKARGKLSDLRAHLAGKDSPAATGLGHTRWATHGPPSRVNAHPHADCRGRLAVVHNGIIENHHELRHRLAADGHEFRSETDTEVLAHLVEECYQGDLLAAVREALAQVEGSYAAGFIHADHPGELVAAKRASPLVVGHGTDASYIASDIPALLPLTRRISVLDDGELVRLRPGRVEIFDERGAAVTREPLAIKWSVAAAEKQGYEHFMLKEIFEQPAALRQTIAGCLDLERGTAELDLEFPDKKSWSAPLAEIRRVVFLACGTAWHAGLVGKYLVEDLARLPAEAVVASEFRYGKPVLDRHTLVVAISQSGETADTLAGVQLARKNQAEVLAICNVQGSSIARASTACFLTKAGPEIGVASTKAYTTQLAAVLLFAVQLAQAKKRMKAEEAGSLLRGLNEAAQGIERVLDGAPAVEKIAERYREAKGFLFLGRTYNLATALEGALKLKEIAYVHAEGYGAGEMKHGPIALVEDGMPVFVVAPRGPVYPKILGNIEEILARGGHVIAVAGAGDETIGEHAEQVLRVAEGAERLSPILAVVPLQLFAYYMARLRGLDPDQPRNLAKSVTVE